MQVDKITMLKSLPMLDQMVGHVSCYGEYNSYYLPLNEKGALHV